MEVIKLDSGLRLVLVPQPQAVTVTSLVMVQTGSKYETLANNGVSHFLEHLFFKGCQKWPTAQLLASQLDSLGADFNAFTSKEYTGYYIKTAAEHLKISVEILADMLQQPLLPAEEIEREKQVVIEEFNMYLDSPRQYVEDVLEGHLYQGQAAGWQVLGTKENIKKMTRQQIVDYWQQQYTASNVIVYLIGNFQASEVKSLVVDNFKNLKQATANSKVAVQDQPSSSKVVVHHKDTDQSHLALSVRAFGASDDRVPTLVLLSTILGGGMSSRLFDEVREKRGLCYYVFSRFVKYSDHGYLAIRGGLATDRLEESLLVMVAELKKLTTNLVSEAELAKVKSALKGKLALSLETSDSLAFWLAEQQMVAGEMLTLIEVVEKLEAVTAAQIQSLAQELFKPEAFNLAIIGPVKSDLWQSKFNSLVSQSFGADLE